MTGFVCGADRALVSSTLQIIHSSVVDTAIVFPHRKGLPYKRALKTLMVEYLQKFIQDNIGKLGREVQICFTSEILCGETT